MLPVMAIMGYGQKTVLSGTGVNRYTPVNQIFCSEGNDVDTLEVASAAGFGEGDTVMLYCVQGATIELTDIFGEDEIGRDAQIPRNTGKYGFFIIVEIVGNQVVLNTTVTPEIKPMEGGEVAQLIRVPSYHRAEVAPAGIRAPDWNGSTGTGGVIAMFVRTTLTLNGDIDVSGAGFWGATHEEIYNGDCSSVDTDLYDSMFYHSSNVRAGIKGEGTTDTRFELTRGKARNINGGGGGNALLSGGGGGSNYRAGGNGGGESSACGPGVEETGGIGGFDLGRPGDAYYINGNSLNRGNRIFMGGGGGIGTRVDGKFSTPGGNGGGIVVIVADTIDGGGGNWIRADGDAVTVSATGAGGGGGGGGAIILDVSGYRNNPHLSAVGGDGGHTAGTDTTGPGGGGGGGIYWLAGSNEPGLTLALSTSNSGEHLSEPSIKYGAADGSSPGRKDGLDVPIRGFLFNSVPSEFWICSDQVPDTINASLPKGGDGTYTYAWVDSSSTQNQWLPVPGATSRYLSFTSPLPDTTYYRRVVTSGLLVPDTSFRIAVYVHQAITGNMITAPDTVCSGDAPKAFSPVGEPGGALGPGTFSYLWVKNEGSGSYAEADGNNDLAGYQPPGLTVTTDFARIVYSGACKDTSGALMVTVFDTIVNNVITDNDTICWNTRPDLITGPVPDGGDEPDKRYMWQSKASGVGDWTDEGVTTREYRPGPLTETTLYRRVVFSGSDDACISYSEPVEILNIDTIRDNLILTDDQTVCTNDQPALLAGSPGAGGDGNRYYYRWESRTESTGWSAADNTHPNDMQSYMPPVMIGDSMIYRRVVSSGGLEGVCKDTSASVAIHVLPSITGNDILADVTVNCQYDLLADLTQDPASGTEPGGGATRDGTDDTRHYKWEEATGMTLPAEGWTEISYGTGALDYTDNPVLSSAEDYWYRRIVFSGPELDGQRRVCADTSQPIQITIHTAISNNTLDAADSACHDTEKVLGGSAPEGEPGMDPGYRWLDADTWEELGTGRNLPYTFTSLDTRNFVRETRIGVCEDTSDALVITIMELPGGILSGDLHEACEKTIQLEVDLNMDELSRYTIPWEVSLLEGDSLLPGQFLRAEI